MVSAVVREDGETEIEIKIEAKEELLKLKPVRVMDKFISELRMMAREEAEPDGVIEAEVEVKIEVLAVAVAETEGGCLVR